MEIEQYELCLEKQKALLKVSQAWKVNTDREYIPISLGGISFPLVREESYVQNSKVGKFTIRDEQLHSVSVNAMYQGKAKSSARFSKRPTLYVSLPGFKRSNTSIDPWQKELENRILENTLEHSQYRHMQVEWDSDENMRDQVRDLGDVVYEFLNERKYKWDIVIVGFSRGGIFAHDLGMRIRESNKIQNLVTVLLDPTAAPLYGDSYPKSGISVPHGKHHGYLFYDNAGFICGSQYPSALCRSQFSTTSDKPISGYTNNDRDDFATGLTNHEAVAEKWADNTGPGSMRFSTLWHDLNLMKPAGNYEADGLSGLDVVKISRRNIQLNGDITLENDTLKLAGELDLGKLGTQSIEFSAGKDGIELGANVLVASAYALASKDRIEASTSIVVSDLGAKLDANGFEAKYETLGVVSGEVKADLGEMAISVEIFGSEVDLQFNTGKVVLSVGREFLRTVERVGGLLEDAVGGAKKLIKGLF
ncbi:hypothetical protein [Pseudoalteromonas luteoviolacea]|uniref:Uncharacterized protein n=1 Tax=Pseudoalteromonas luteoviolacea NCIMB 1942 TaxID=1365253 RepID=A0A167BXN4_9GAMM|nr:hypothetical protein [Pseudoalteromonas luteoviolacea]KZN47015.1 hypothetical protein N482_02020 [Pseudoalteromonas luteoviolacea NCIMB 1942]